MYVNENTVAHEFFVCPVARQGTPERAPRAPRSEATDNSDMSDDDWGESQNQQYYLWNAKNQAIVQQVQREIYAYRELQRDLSVSRLAGRALQRQERRLSCLAFLASHFNTDPISTFLLHKMCEHVAVLARRP